MDQALFLTVLQKAMTLAMILGAPILLSAIVVGLTISIIQSVTQIQEQTLTFVPKIFTALLVLIVAAPWMTDVFTSTTRELLEFIVEFIK
jgi:flagellar biosynthetic protein FliQ